MPGGEEVTAVFEVQGETAMAWYFVMAHWSLREIQPRIRLDGRPMRILVAENPKAFAEIDTVLTRAVLIGGEVARSASVLLAEIQKRRGPSIGEGDAATYQAV